MSSGMHTGQWRPRIPPVDTINAGVIRVGSRRRTTRCSGRGDGMDGAPPLIWVLGARNRVSRDRDAV